MIASVAPPPTAASCSADTRPVITSCLNSLAALPVADRILVIRLGALGDVARTLPSLVALRAQYPGAHIGWLVERKASGVLEEHPALDDLLIFPREELAEAARSLRLLVFVGTFLRFVRRLRRGRFDLVLDFHAIAKSGLLAWLSGAPVRVTYARPVAREGAWRFANRRAELSRGKKSRYERNAALLRFLRVDPELREAAPLPLAPASLARPQLELDPRFAWVAIHPGTSAATAYKRYTVHGYARVARDLFERGGTRCLVTFGPGAAERAVAEAIVAESKGAAELAPATEGVADLAVLLSRCALLVGSDSGPLHIASLVGTPVVQILGPTDPVENAPWEHTASRTVRIPLACSPCRRGCEAATCMRIISPERVSAAAGELLASREPRSRRGWRRAAGPLAQPSAPGP